MKITVVSDWHGNFKRTKDIPTSDVICVCGDMIGRSYDMAVYPNWLENLPARLVLVIPGNHDVFLYEHWAPDSIKVFNPTKTPVEYKGVTFGGFCWSYTEDPILEEVWKFMTTNRSFLSERLGCLPRCDVLLSHSPPLGCDMEIFNGLDIGVPGMLPWAKQNRCQLIVCGHVHEHSGKIFEADGVKVVNAACTIVTLDI